MRQAPEKLWKTKLKNLRIQGKCFILYESAGSKIC